MSFSVSPLEQAILKRLTITSTCYRLQYHTFSLSLTLFGVLCNGLTRVTTKFLIIYIFTFLKKILVTRGNALQIAQNQAKTR